jgi:hypothetical protein
MGGTFLTKAGLEWAFFIFSLMSLPPDPALVGDSWRAIGCSTSDAMRIGSTDRYARTTQRSNAQSMPSVVGPMVIRMQSRACLRD